MALALPLTGTVSCAAGENSAPARGWWRKPRGFSKPPEKEARPSEGGHPGGSGKEAGAAALGLFKPQLSVLSHPRDGQSPEPRTFGSETSLRPSRCI